MSYSRSHCGKGSSYSESFKRRWHRRHQWDLEQRIIQETIGRLENAESNRILDFAGGTGRIANRAVEEGHPTVVFDISPSMLAVAANTSNIMLVRGDCRRGVCFRANSFGLVTAFRFFPKAEPSLRRNAMAFIRETLAPGGFFLMNNHCNSPSLIRRMAVLIGGDPGVGYRHKELCQLMEDHGFRLEGEWPIAVFPVTDNRGRSWKRVAGCIDQIALHHHWLRPLAQNVVYLWRLIK